MIHMYVHCSAETRLYFGEHLAILVSNQVIFGLIANNPKRTILPCSILNSVFPSFGILATMAIVQIL